MVIAVASGSLVFAQDTATTSGNSATPSFYQDGSTLYSTSKTKFRLTASDVSTNVDYIEYKVDDGAFNRYTEPFSLTGDGVHQIVYYAVDTVGNKEPDSTLTVVIDDTAPEITLANNSKTYTSASKLFASGKSEITLAASDNLCGLKVIRYSINGGAMQDYSGPIIANQNGSFTLEYTAKDNLGNATPIASYSIDMDDSPPTVKIEPSSPLRTVGDVSYAKKGSGFKIEATDLESGSAQTFVRIDEKGDFVPATKELFFDAPGSHVIEAKAVDNVGNESAVQRFEFVLDDAPPTSVITPISQ